MLLLLSVIDLGTILDSTAQDTMWVDGFDRDVFTRVHLADVGCEGALLLVARVETEDVVPELVVCQLLVINERSDLDRRPRLPAASEASTEELGGVDFGVVDLRRIQLQEPVELGHELLQEAEGQEAAVFGPVRPADVVALAAEQDHTLVHWSLSRKVLADALDGGVGDAIHEPEACYEVSTLSFTASESTRLYVLLMSVLLARTGVASDVDHFVNRVIEDGEDLVQLLVYARLAISSHDNDTVDGSLLEFRDPLGVERLSIG